MLDIKRIRTCSHLLEAPAPKVVGELCDEVERLQRRSTSLESLLKEHCSNAAPGLQERIDAALKDLP